ncbi:MAG: hypothetical protein LAT64_06765 [Phycisphaerales bacterium]|nr:hypothetical protein [Planctomycetota bacterium]MCH8508457.1 hypothetical protein [Phycisphaerales bacterium]
MRSKVSTRRPAKWWGIGLCGLTAGALVACAQNGNPAVSGPESQAEQQAEPGAYLPDFDRAWELVRDTYHDPAMGGLDWDAARDELRPRAEQARTRTESRAVINEMVSRLGESHFGIIPEGVDAVGADNRPEAGVSGDAIVGFDLRVVDGRAVVTSVLPGGPAEAAGVRPGWIVASVDGAETETVITGLFDAVGERAASMYAWQTIHDRLSGPPGSTAEIRFLDANDRPLERSLTRVEAEGETVKFGNLPAVNVRLDSRWLSGDETGDPDARIGYIAFNMFMIPITPHFERAMSEFRDADGIVIDLRGNIGGVAIMCATLSRYFVTERSRIGTMKMRGQDLQFNAEPVVVTTTGQRLPPFAGPLAILIDGGTASTSEFMAGGLRGLGRARTFGSTSAGMALPAAMTRLPSGDVLMHAIADYESSDGARLEHDGVPADVPVPVTRADLLAGVDATLRAAAEWIAGQRDD